ncbi:MAG: DUF3048 domain-containing protein [Actinomycetota bacterium]|nr:DUF3048 domain-containing protein [Actinomycetota bacterium]
MPKSSSHSRPSGLARLRSKLGLRWRRAGTKTRVTASVAVVVVLAVIVAGVISAASTPHRKAAAGSSSTTSTTTTTAPRAKAKAQLCPLTHTPAPHGRVPRRPALAVKIGNDPASRPQTGLPEADIVYEQMAEGGITRYMAIFQCQEAPVIGPVRSVRWDDWHELEPYGHPILAISGGIIPWDNKVASLTWLYDANASEGPAVGAFYRTSNRVPPWNLYTSSKTLWSLDPNHQPPPPQFSYSKLTPSEATTAKAATITNFAAGATVQWTWSARLGVWLRSIGGVPDIDSSGSQLQAKNVIIEMVPTRPGPYAESGTTPDVESLTVGSGPAWVLRDGKVEKGTWNSAGYADLTHYRFPDGNTMTLTPGNTWVELVPNQFYPVAIQR